MTLRQKIELIIDDYMITDIDKEMMDKIMNEISKEVYGKSLHGMKYKEGK